MKRWPGLSGWTEMYELQPTRSVHIGAERSNSPSDRGNIGVGGNSNISLKSTRSEPDKELILLPFRAIKQFVL